MLRLNRAAVLVAGFSAIGITTASAQVIGTFRWQFAPYCNVVTLRVEQQGGVYELLGTDNQCGAARRAAASGSAHLNPDGSITVAVNVTRPDGVRVAANAAITLATLSGSWSDDAGNSGTLAFNPPAAPSGQPRPLRYAGTYATGATALGSAFTVHGVAFPRLLPTAPTAVDANVVRMGQPPTAACPGSAANLIAAPGQLCLYEQVGVNLFHVGVARSNPTWLCGFADRSGFSVVAYPAASGDFWSVGAWAVTVP